MKKPLIILGLAITAIIGWIKFSTFFFIYPLYLHLQGRIIDATGINPFLANAIAAILAIPTFYLILWMFSLDKTKRQIGIIVFFLGLSACNFVMFNYHKDIYFDWQTGTGNKYYFVKDQKICIEDNPGYSQKYGLQKFPVTSAVAEKYYLQQQQQLEEQNRINNQQLQNNHAYQVIEAASNTSSINWAWVTDFGRFMGFAFIILCCLGFAIFIFNLVKE